VLGLKAHLRRIEKFAVTAGKPAPFAKGFQVTAFLCAYENCCSTTDGPTPWGEMKTAGVTNFRKGVTPAERQN
jgi:hypothetical protein